MTISVILFNQTLQLINNIVYVSESMSSLKENLAGETVKSQN